jgi:hypothetical protein
VRAAFGIGLSGSMRGGEVFGQLSDCQLFNEDSDPR